jgi:hypothetical protein
MPGVPEISGREGESDVLYEKEEEVAPERCTAG